MNLKNLIAVGASVALLTTAVPSRPSLAAPPRPELQARANAIVAAGAPGVSVEVRDEHGSWNGVAASTGPRPDPARQFRVGSATKSFTATMVLQLVAEQRIELDAPVERYLPGLLPYRQTITVRHLLQHRSGLFDYRDELWPNLRAVRDSRFRHYAPAQLVRIATRQSLGFDPGTRFSYSNTNYIILGLLIEKVTQRSVAGELERRIIRPAGLRHTYLAGDFPFLLRPAMRGYELVDGALTDLTAYNMTVSWTTGAIVSTAADLNRFYRALLTGKLLPAAELKQMQQALPAFPGFGYGLGLANGELCGQQIWGHVGGAPGYLTYTFTRSDGKRQITITVNVSLTVTKAVEEAIGAMLATEFCG